MGIATGSEDGKIRVWDLSKWKCAKILNTNSGPVTSLLQIKNTQELVSSTRSGIKLWNFKSGQCVKSLFTGPVESLLLLPYTGHLVTGGSDGTLKVWLLTANNSKRNKYNYMEHHQHYVIKEHDHSVNSLQFIAKSPSYDACKVID